jgi:hypothetical protein
MLLHTPSSDTSNYLLYTIEDIEELKNKKWVIQGIKELIWFIKISFGTCFET